MVAWALMATAAPRHAMDRGALRRAGAATLLRDLIAPLPAIWKTYDPQQIADNLAAALVSMLDADFVYIVLPGQRDQPVTEVTCTGDGSANSSVAIRWAVLEWLSKRSLEDTGEIPDPLREGDVRVAFAPIGFAADAALIAGSRDADFPTKRSGSSSGRAPIRRPSQWTGGARRRTSGASRRWWSVLLTSSASPAWRA